MGIFGRRNVAGKRFQERRHGAMMACRRVLACIDARHRTRGFMPCPRPWSPTGVNGSRVGISSGPIVAAAAGASSHLISLRSR